MRIYTSGWPKNQNRCWKRIGSPPPAGSKNVVFRFRSVRSMVMAAANTGMASRSKIAVKNTDQTNSGQLYGVVECGVILIQVVIKLMAPKIEDAPARCSAKIVMSIDGLECAMFPASGG